MTDLERMLRVKSAIEQLYYKGIEAYSGRNSERKHVLRECFFQDINEALAELHELRVISAHECLITSRTIDLQFHLGFEVGKMSLMLPRDLIDYSQL